MYRSKVTALKRLVFRAALFSTIFLAVGYASLFFFVRSARFQQWLKSEAFHRTGHEINFSDLRLTFPFRVSASGLTISKDSETLFQGERIKLTLSFIDLFSKSIYRLELEKPVFHIDLQKLFDSSANNSMAFAVRHLNVENGTVVLKTREAQSFEFRAVNLNAQNFNMGQASGMTLHMDLPWATASAEILIHGETDEQEAVVKIRQTPPRDFARLRSQKTSSPEAVSGKIRLRRMDSQALAISASGQVNGLRIGAEKVNGRLQSLVEIDAGFKQAIVSAKIEATELPGQIGSVKLPVIAGGGVGSLEGTYSFPEETMTLKTFHLSSTAGMVDGQGVIFFRPAPTFAKTHMNLTKMPIDAIKPFLPETAGGWTLRGTAEATLDLEGPWNAVAIKGMVRTNGAELHSEAFSLRQLSLTAPFGWANSTLRASPLRIEATTIAAKRSELRLAGEQLQLDGAVEFTPNEPLKANGNFRLLRGRYATSDGSKMGENFVLAGHLDLTTRDQKISSLAGKFNLEQGELLWGKFFGDFKAARPELEFDGDYLPNQDEFQLRKLDLSLTNVGKVGLSGTIQQISHQPVARLQINGDGIQPSGVFDFFIRETLGRSYPILNELTLGGRVDLAAQASGPFNDLVVEGRLQAQRTSLRAKSDQWQIGPMTLTLPFRARWPAATNETVSDSARNGTLVIESLRFGSESVPAFKATVSLWNNALRVTEPIRLPVYGGTIEIRNLAWDDLIKNPHAFSLSIETQGLQLQRLAEALDWYRFGGTLSASIPKVEITGSILRSEGQTRIDVFGGHVQLSKMEIENPFSSLPAIKLEARFQAIHLDQASETFAFGHISGILEGTVTDLVITDGQPAQMQADVHTVARSDSSQWISIEALDKITVLSSGQNGSLVYGGIAGFFDEFRYSKMGFKATLRNDQLTLRGVESQDEKEFLVVGSFLPPTVNVISHTREIGFSDLIKRLQQIQKSNKPQIK